MLSLTQLAELEAQRRQLKREAATVARNLRCAKRRRSKVMEKARNLTPNDLAQLLAEKTAVQQARHESYGAVTQSFCCRACA
jgi:ATP-dependent exoDNAse (exonuclease V) beta subunit